MCVCVRETELGRRALVSECVCVCVCERERAWKEGVPRKPTVTQNDGIFGHGCICFLCILIVPV